LHGIHHAPLQSFQNLGFQYVESWRLENVVIATAGVDACQNLSSFVRRDEDNLRCSLLLSVPLDKIKARHIGTKLNVHEDDVWRKADCGLQKFLGYSAQNKCFTFIATFYHKVTLTALLFISHVDIIS
jgi:hypothetical protein